MKLLHKLQNKLSWRQIYYYIRAGQPTDHLIHSLDLEDLKKLLQYKEQTGHPQYRKYFNARYWLRENIRRALYLKINTRKPMTILDIGAGFGYFPYVAKFYGHNVLGIDIPDDKLFQKAAEFFGIQRQEYTIEPFIAIPSFGKKFDLVTSFQVCFNGHIENELWQEKEWDFFLQDMFDNHMNKGGKIYLELNWSPVIKQWLPTEVKSLFKNKYRARFDGPSRVILRAPA